MIWVAWRQHRAQLIVLAALLLIGSAAILMLTSSMAQSIQDLGLQQCATGSGDCTRRDEFQDQWSDMMKAGQLGIAALPLLLGVFSAAPLFSREIEHGTHILAFTQSVSRLRWMTTKIAMLLVPSLIVTVVLQLLVNRWVATANMLGPLKRSPYFMTNFDSTGPMPVVYLLFSFAAGALLGALLRRSLVTMVSTLVALFAVRLAVSEVHLEFLPVERKTSPELAGMSANPGEQVVNRGYLSANGDALPSSAVSSLDCGTRGNESLEQFLHNCYGPKGVVGSYVDVISASALPGLRLAEVAIFGIAAALMLVGTAWTLRRQH